MPLSPKEFENKGIRRELCKCQSGQLALKMKLIKLKSYSTFDCSNVDGTKWMTREQLQERLRENISEKAHGTFLLSISHLMQHPYAYEVEEFIKEYRTAITSTQTDFSFIVEPSMGEDGRSYVTMNGNFED